MTAKQYTAQLIEDLVKANEVAIFAKSIGQVIGDARGVPKDMALFTAEAWITLGLPTLKLSVYQLTSILSGMDDIKGLDDPENFEALARAITDQFDKVAAAIDKVLSGEIVVMPYPPVAATIIVNALNDIHKDAYSLHGTYTNIKNKRV